MRILCLILSVYVMLLSARACCADKDCQIGEHKSTNSKAPVKEKECAGCSPFFTCGSCVGFILSKHISIALPHFKEPTVAHSTCYKQPFVEMVILAIWQPPQLS